MEAGTHRALLKEQRQDNAGGDDDSQHPQGLEKRTHLSHSGNSFFYSCK
jgi:hypothetical protein